MAKIETPQQLFRYKLGAALKMEETVLEMLEKLEEKANDSEIKQLLRHHHQETEQQVQNIRRAFDAIGSEAEDQPCPAIEGIEKEGESNLKQVDDTLNDSIILGGAVETEHHEIAVYNGLITKAEAMGEQDVVALLQENLEQEEHTLKEVEQKAQKLAREMAGATI
jgi:ferritin-like metal-binding protein YciE